MNYMWIGIGLVLAMVVWKFVLQPIVNEDKPIEPPEDYKTIPEQLEESVKLATDSITTDLDF